MLSFEPSEEQAMVKETIAGFATDQIEPLMREMDEAGMADSAKGRPH
jgi:hypothetical protein